MKLKKETLHINGIDIFKHTRSPFANISISGCGAHKTKKDYNRKNLKKEDKKVFDSYKRGKGDY